MRCTLVERHRVHHGGVSTFTNTGADQALQSVLDSLTTALDEADLVWDGGAVPFFNWDPPTPMALTPEDFSAAVGSASVEMVRRASLQPGLPATFTAILAEYPDWQVRGNAGARVRDADVLSKLLSDSDPRVRGVALSNPGASIEDVRRLATDRRFEVRCCVAADSRTPQDVQWELARDKSSRVRGSLLFPAPVSDDIIEFLTADVDPDVAGQARGVLFQRQYEREHSHPIGGDIRGCPACARN